MQARRAPATLLLHRLLSLCAMAAGLLLSPSPAAAASAEPTTADDIIPALSGDDRWWWPADAPTAAAAPAGGGTGYDDAIAAVADDAVVVVAAPAAATAHRFRPRYDSAVSPGAKRELEHEARCGPRVPVRRGFPWPEWKPNCRREHGVAGAGGLGRRPWDEP
uniref:Uncharacterized protein n=1 Tax=Oryza glumipatula TaxID=40148 RepID=A0A0E0BCJ5_9ORYZ